MRTITNMIFRYSLSLVCIILCSAFSSQPKLKAAELPAGYKASVNRQVEALDELCHATANTGLFTGSVLVGIDGEVIYKKGFGLANREWNNPNSPSTKFRLASVSKPFCSVLVLQLVQEGKLNLQDSITDWLPTYRADTGDRITIHHLLSHQSGIKDFTANYDYRGSISRLPSSKDNFIEEHCSNDLIHEPGTIYAYCNAGYIILGRIIEKITRKTFEENVQSRIFEPLNMTSSGYDRNRYVLPQRASGYTLGPFETENAQYLDMDSSPGPAGSLYSTVEDLFRFHRALRTEDLLSKKYRAIMLTPNQDVPEVKAAGGRPKSTYGYGWNIFNRSHPITKHRTRIASHGGAINGFRAMMSCLTDDDIFVVVLCNQADANGKSAVWNSLQRLSREMIHIATAQPYRLPPRAAVPQERRMYDMIKKEGLQTALQWYQKNGKKAPWGGTHNSVAKQLLKDGMTTEGLALMESDLKETPTKVWLLRATAQAHLDNGKPEKALQYAVTGLAQKPADPKLLTIKTEAEDDLDRL